VRVLRYSSGIELLGGWLDTSSSRPSRTAEDPARTAPEQAPPALSGVHATALAKRACSFTQRSSEPGSISSNWPHGTTFTKRLHVALKVRHAHSQRRGRLGPCEQPARHRLDRTIPRTPRHPGNLLGRQTIRRVVKSAGRIARVPAASGQGLPARSGSQLSRPASLTPACHPIAQPEDVD
jgi:hypothetical protein